METTVLEKGKGTNEMFDTWKWLLKAKSTDETRPAINLIQVSEKRAVATDGYRLHIANVKDSGVKPGLYRVLASTAKQIVLQEDTEGHLYPDIKQVIPRHMGRCIDLSYEKYDKKLSAPAFIAAKVIRALDEPYAINLGFLEDCTKDGAWKMYVNPKSGGPLYFRNCTRSAVIMPLRIA